MDPLNLRYHGGHRSQGRIAQDAQTCRRRRIGHKDRFVQFAQIDFGTSVPGFGSDGGRQLEADVKAGAVGIGEIVKEFGLTSRKADGAG